MTAIPLLVCDDSNMARKQLIRALPANWPFRITQATNGLEGLEAIRAGAGQIVLLDLTMPELDGFGVLAALREVPLTTPATDGRESEFPLPNVSFRDAFREVSNVAMGRAAELLGRVLNLFIKLPIPNVNILEVGALHMALADAQRGQRLSAICQGFIGGGVAGEALLIFHDSEIGDVAQLLNAREDENAQLEMLLDLASIIIGACLNGLSEQLNITLSQGHPMVLGQHCPIEDLIRINQRRWKRTLAVEISYGLEDLEIHFDLLLLFTEDSVPRLRETLDFMIN